MTEPGDRRARVRALRWAWFAGGWIAVALGTIGAFVPVMPSTVFFIIAAACFARSSPRFEAWLLALPGVGPLVSDYRAGLGMPRAAKRWAIAMIVLFCSLSAWAVRGRPAIAGAAAALGAIGVGYLLWRVPTREKVLEGAAVPERPTQGTA
jgi:uncharacterized membrane protein YbaN (DUF454 family)